MSKPNYLQKKKTLLDSSLHQKEFTVQEQNIVENSPEVDVFISYCWANKQSATKLKSALEMRGIKCWFDDGNMRGGEHLFEAIDKGISASTVVISCLSNQYGASVNCKREVRLAAERKKILIPVMIDVCNPFPPRGDMGPLLAGLIYIDLHDDDLFSSNLEQLVSALKQTLPSFAAKGSFLL